MKRLPLSLALALALAAPAIGCRTSHLGPNTGHAYRDALSSQRESEAQSVAPIDADDARAVLDKHRGSKTDRGARAGARTTSSSSSGSSAPSLGSGSGSGSFGPAGREIRLDAK